MPMLDQIILRRASIAEAARLGRLAFAAWESSMAHVIRADSEEQIAEDRNALLLGFQLFCINNSPSITVADRNGALVGWVAHDSMSAYISDLWVDPAFQRKEIGRALLHTTEQQIFRAGFDVSTLETHAENGGAIRFYAREGYTVVWRGMKFSRMVGQRIEKVRMEKQLVVPAH